MSQGSKTPIESYWAIEASFATQLIEALQRVPEAVGNYSTCDTVNMNGVAVIEVRGILTKYPSYMQVVFGGAATTDLSAAISAAINDQSIHAVCIVGDGPGGGVSGIPECADVIYAARQSGKQVVFQIDGTCASALYYLASQAGAVYASHKANRVGSIGTMQVIEDSSKQAAMEGREVIAETTGELKKIGIPGVAVTDEMKAYMRKSVAALQADFSSAIQRGRTMTAEQVKAVEDGRVMMAKDAIAAGLIDGIQSLEVTLAALQGSSKKTKTKGNNMAGASFAEIKAGCVGASPDFIVQCLESGLEINQAVANWEAKRALVATEQVAKIAEQATQIVTLQTELAAEKLKVAEATKVKNPPAGGARQAVAEGDEVSAMQQFREGVNALVKDGMSRERAVSQFVRDNGDLYKQFLAEAQAQKGGN